MPQLNKEQRVFVVRTYYETKKYSEVINLFSHRFPGQDPPNKTTIWRNVNKYENHATSLNRKPKNSGRKRIARSEENIDAVQATSKESSDSKMRQLTVQLSDFCCYISSIHCSIRVVKKWSFFTSNSLNVFQKSLRSMAVWGKTRVDIQIRIMSNTFPAYSVSEVLFVIFQMRFYFAGCVFFDTPCIHVLHGLSWRSPL